MKELTNITLNNVLKGSVRKYVVLVKAYQKNSPHWKQESTWERYWQDMNKLEDRIDLVLSLCENYRYKPHAQSVATYERMMEIRHVVTINANV